MKLCFTVWQEPSRSDVSPSQRRELPPTQTVVPMWYGDCKEVTSDWYLEKWFPVFHWCSHSCAGRVQDGHHNISVRLISPHFRWLHTNYHPGFLPISKKSTYSVQCFTLYNRHRWHKSWYQNLFFHTSNKGSPRKQRYYSLYCRHLNLKSAEPHPSLLHILISKASLIRHSK